MVATKKSHKNTKKVPSTRLKQSKKISWKLVFPVVVLAAIAGIYFVYSSMASTSNGTVATRNVSFTASHTTNRVKSSDGRLCVATRFDNKGIGGVARNTYFWEVKEDNYSKLPKATSKSYTANGNRDHECFDVDKGKMYKVRFVNKTSLGSTSGSYYVSGFYRK